MFQFILKKFSLAVVLGRDYRQGQEEDSASVAVMIWGEMVSKALVGEGKTRPILDILKLVPTALDAE